MQLVEGVGINDANYVVEKRMEMPRVDGKRNRKLVWRCPFYQLWRNMLMRVYNKKYQERCPTYKDCSVWEEWLRFSIFKSWVETQNWEGKQLDKDLLIKGNRLYSPDTCCFVDSFTDMFVVDALTKTGTCLPGVYWNKNEERYMAQICAPKELSKNGYLGYFDSEVEANEAYLKAKSKYAVFLANKQDDPRAAKALIERFVIE